MARRVNLIPMAGAGRRFAEAGYTIPKPLIPVAGVPMVVRAARCLPKADKWIFICREHHIDTAGIDNVLKEHFPGAQIIILDHLTAGQASTCLLASDLLNPDDKLTIGACDNAMTYDRTSFERALSATGTDALIWTFRQNPVVLQNPCMYGWVATDSEDKVRRVSCKVPISTTPMQDHAVIGAFSFRRADIFLKSAQAMIDRDRRVGAEYYIDVALDVAIELGYKVRVLEVDQYICWGTPQDLDIYNYWRLYFGSIGLE